MSREAGCVKMVTNWPPPSRGSSGRQLSRLNPWLWCRRCGSKSQLISKCLSHRVLHLAWSDLWPPKSQKCRLEKKNMAKIPNRRCKTISKHCRDIFHLFASAVWRLSRLDVTAARSPCRSGTSAFIPDWGPPLCKAGPQDSWGGWEVPLEWLLGPAGE